MGDPFGVGLTTKVLSSLLADGVKQAGSSLRKYYSEPDYLAIPERPDLSRIVDIVERQIQGGQNVATDLQEYLRSAECVTLLEHLMIFKLAGRVIETDGPLFQELSNGAAVYGNVTDRQLRQLFTIFVGVADLVIKAAQVTRADDLSAEDKHRASSVIVETTLAAIEGHVRTLAELHVEPIDERRSLLQSYRASVSGVLGRIQPPSFDGIRSVPLESLYVTPRLELLRLNNPSISIDVLLQHPRAVILGDPGGGKTTLVKKIASSLASGSMQISRGRERLIPFVVLLREYGAELSTDSISIAEFISRAARATFQVDLSVSTVEWILASGQALVIFDGLDELLRTDSRRKIADAITAFSIRYPNTKILVTSRRVGYLQAPLPAESFDVIALGNLDPSQVELYVKNWFELDQSLTANERERVTSAFLAESDVVNDLRANPLMLALMCTIYRAEGYIPRNRPDMYEKCSRMLFDRWDRHRGLLEPFEFEAHVEPALMYMAHAIFGNEELQSGVPEDYLVNLATEYLQTWQYADRIKAGSAARAFIEFCRGRAWIFSDVGLDADENPLFQFTHRTFLEFFTAAHLARVAPTLDELCETLGKRIERGEWDVVAQLALQIRAKPLQGGPDIVMRSLLARLERQTADIGAVSNIVQFITRCLSFTIISPIIVQEVSDSLVRHLITMSAGGREPDARESLAGVWSSALEIREKLIDAIADGLIHRLQSGRGSGLRCTAGLTWAFCRSSQRGKVEHPCSEHVERLGAALSKISAKHPSWRWLTVERFERRELSAADLAQRLGNELVRNMFEVPGVKVYLHTPVFRALRHILYSSCDDSDQCEELIELVTITGNLIAERGHLLPDRPNIRGVNELDESFYARPESTRRHRELNDQELISATVLLARHFELAHKRFAKLIVRRLSRTRFRTMGPFFKARLLGEPIADDAKILKTPGMSRLVSWGHNEISFVHPADRTERPEERLTQPPL